MNNIIIYRQKVFVSKMYLMTYGTVISRFLPTVWFERCVSTSSAHAFSNSPAVSGQPRAMSLDLEKQSGNMASPPVGAPQTEPVKPRRTTKHMLPAQTDTKIMVVWLESLEDCTQFPIGDYCIPTLGQFTG